MERKFAQVPDGLGRRVAPLLPPERPKPRGGRPRVPDRTVLAGILYRLRTGCQWKALPDCFGSGATCHRRMQQWVRAGIFKKVFRDLLRRYDRKRGIQWKWTSLDTAMVKAPKGGGYRAKPDGPGETGSETARSDRWSRGAAGGGDDGRERERQVDGGAGVGCGCAPGPTRTPPSENLCLNKGYDYADVEREVRNRGIRPHIRRRGEQPLLGCVQGKPRRCVVERTSSWHNRFRGLLIRWERKAENYLAMVHLACGIIAFRQAA